MYHVLYNVCFKIRITLFLVSDFFFQAFIFQFQLSVTSYVSIDPFLSELSDIE